MTICALRLPFWAALVVLIPFPAAADMGLAPASTGDVYISGEGGYLSQNGGDVNVYGISPAPGTVLDANLSPDNGWFAGGQIGWEKGSRLISFLPFTRVEIYGFGGQADESRSSSAPPLSDITLKSVDGNVNVIGGSRASASVDRQFFEFGYRSEFDQTIDASRTITWGLVSFIRNSDDSSDVLCSNACGLHRSSDVETWMFGNMLMMEPEYRFTQGVSLVGRLGVGFYTYEADAKFRSYASGVTPDPFRAYVRDDDDGVGFRGALGAGLKFILAPASFLETFAEADYFSDVATAHFSNSRPTDNTPSRIGTDDLWELRAGARLTIGLGSGN